ncbi:hypothetical protein GB927_017385 [Shinella sp. CPCC 100929]|uniref:Uncharacterized protein n=1 Tax=Shinella lacus TaxID=2654216 RepID=A0ABT1R9U7_9HYPH|nr:hypothetical protein [Shinella lacus]MCQ4631826.1 hypothetical protein [Shinella lacus]
MAFLLSGSAIHRPSMGFRAAPVIVHRQQGPGGGSNIRFPRRALCREVVAKAADPAKRLIGYGVNRSTIAFSQKAIDQSNECF